MISNRHGTVRIFFWSYCCIFWEFWSRGGRGFCIFERPAMLPSRPLILGLAGWQLRDFRLYFSGYGIFRTFWWEQVLVASKRMLFHSIRVFFYLETHFLSFYCTSTDILQHICHFPPSSLENGCQEQRSRETPLVPGGVTVARAASCSYLQIRGIERNLCMSSDSQSRISLIFLSW
jgi:hypothetical protein